MGISALWNVDGVSVVGCALEPKGEGDYCLYAFINGRLKKINNHIKYFITNVKITIVYHIKFLYHFQTHFYKNSYYSSVSVNTDNEIS